MVDLRETAFGPTPGAPVGVRPGMAHRDRWLVAVALGGQGRYAAAAAELHRLLTEPHVPAAVAAHAAVTLAAHRRQLGGHALARIGDGLGLRIATTATKSRRAMAEVDTDTDGTGAEAARIDALVGLAADAVGLGEPLTAEHLLDSAESSSNDHPSWRLPVRIGWVRAELALLRGRPADALPPAAAATALACANGAARHHVKSAIVHTVARALAGDVEPEAAVGELDRLAAECVRAGLMPLQWPCQLAAADLIGRTGSGANDEATHMAQRSPTGRRLTAPRRRHAALLTMSAIVRRSDPLGRRLLGVSMRPLEFPAVM